MKPRIRLVPLGPTQPLQDAIFAADRDEQTLRELLARYPALSMEPIGAREMDSPLGKLRLVCMEETSDDVPLYRPPGLRVRGDDADQGETRADVSGGEGGVSASTDETPVPTADDTVATAERTEQRAGVLRDRDAVLIAYSREIDELASFLRVGEKGLSVLVYCDKIVVNHLWPAVVRKAGREACELVFPSEEPSGGLMQPSLQQRQLTLLKDMIAALKQGQVLVLPHLDLLVGSTEGNLGNEGREITELLYSHPDEPILAFADRSLTIPEVLSARFAVRRMITGVGRIVIDLDGTERLLGEVFVGAEDAARFEGFEPAGLYKNVAGMNPIQIQHAVCYAVMQVADKRQPQPVEKLYRAIRAFKVQSSASFEIPNVTFEHIGGYGELKARLAKAINLMLGAYDLPETMRSELIPRGFIFYGPPGTGKTLFAKAIANLLNATVQVVSGPEVMDMYVGESERKVRELFAEARRNAPSVLVFDEFDAIAAKRSGREDGGSRAGNAVVAQMLTEMDGFRPDVPMLVIGTTNRVELIDEALLRPSRFQAIAIDLPDLEARRAIAEVHANWFGLRERVSDGLLDVIARSTGDFNGDEIRALFRDARLGLHCEDPPLEPSAYRFGELVGGIRRGKEERVVAESAYDQGRTTSRRRSPGGEPTEGMAWTPVSETSVPADFEPSADAPMIPLSETLD